MSPLSHFERPMWLAVGAVLVVLLLVLYPYFDRRQRHKVVSFSLPRPTDAAALRVSRVLLWLKRAALVGAVAAACVALARPLGPLQLQEVEARGIDILFAVDTSRSMLTPDVRPNRLERAKLAVEDLLDRLDGDGVGLIAFAGDAFLEAPLTTDYDAFRDTLEALDTHSIPFGGTDIASAIDVAMSTFATQGEGDKVLVLLTDGEDLAGNAVTAAKAAAVKGVKIYTVGVGTAAGDLIPVPDETGAQQFVKDPDGNFVKSRLDEPMLRQIAQVTGGAYYALGAQGQGVIQLYQQKLSALARHQISARQIAVYSQLFQWPLGAAIALLILNWLIRPVRRRTVADAAAGTAALAFGSRPVQPASRPAAAAAPLSRQSSGQQSAAATHPRTLLPVILLGLLAGVAIPRAHASALSAQQAYDSGNYALAAREYADSAKRQPSRAQLQFDLGAAAYKAGDYGGAAAAFGNALRTGDVPLQQSTYYNLGNTLYRTGQKTVANDPQATIKTWQQSLAAYNTALQLRPTDADAKFNHDFVQKKLDELKRQQHNQQQQNPQQQNQQKQQNQQGKQNQQGQQGQQNQQGQGGQQNQQNQQNQGGQQNQNGRQQQGQGAQNPQGQGNAPDQQQRSGNQNSRSPSDQRDSQPPGNPPPSPGTQTAATGQPREPGEMTRSEAEQLLDSAKGEERQLAGIQNGTPNTSPPPLRDW